jgi:pimeloyl-ACP methyl ester carboxylesterase
MKKAYVDIPEGQIHYKTDGSGENLLLLHQSPMSSDEFADIIPIVTQSCRVVAMDTLGHGNSDDPPREYEIEDFARSVISFLDAIGVNKTSIAGHHTGATIAVEVAAAYPERVDKLILSGCAVWEPDEWKAFLNQPMTRDLKMTEDGQFLTKTWEKYKGLSSRPEPQLWFKPFIISLKSRTRPYDAHFAVARYNIKPRLPLIKSPTLLISGSEDLFLNRLESTKSLIPRCATGVIEGGGLFICFEKPKEFAQAILNFLKNPGV